MTPMTGAADVVFRDGDTYSYMSATTFETVTWTRQDDGRWSASDGMSGTRWATDDDVRAQLRQDELGLPDPGVYVPVGPVTS